MTKPKEEGRTLALDPNPKGEVEGSWRQPIGRMEYAAAEPRRQLIADKSF